MNLSSQLSSVSFDVPVTPPKQVLEEYLTTLSDNSRKTRKVAFKIVSRFLCEKGVNVGYKELMSDFDAWRHLDDKFMTSLVHWMVKNEYASSTAKSVRHFVNEQFRILHKSGLISALQYAAVRAAGRLDSNFFNDESPWYGRNGVMTDAHAELLKNAHDLDTKKGSRDRALMCILLNHGLRGGELLTVNVEDINFATGMMHVRRHKTKTESNLKLTPETMDAITHYVQMCGISEGVLMRPVNRGDNVGSGGLSLRAVSKQVERMAKTILNGEITLSTHDCRHYWATKRAADGVTAFQLMKEGGWKTIQSVMIYVHDN